MNDMVAAFNEYFEVVDAYSPELLREVFHLRYQVYCIEQRAPGFEASKYPAKMESDDYDRHSSHILLRHRPSGEFVGTARLILSDPLNPEKLFPTEQHTQIDPALIDMGKLTRQHIGEISRLVVIRRFARRKDELLHAIENGTGGEKWTPTNHRRFPHPILALVVGIIRMSSNNNITHCLSLMEPSLNRLLGLFGLKFEPIGPLTEHHGPRRPYHIDLIELLDRMHTNHNEMWELMTDYGKVRIGTTESSPHTNIQNVE
jgi:N-acyl amino acid synthase of PEP-CTERM/exosortase system